MKVDGENFYPQLRKIRKIARKNKKKSFFESIYSKLKEFARVSLASRRVSGIGGRLSFSGSKAAGLNNSGNIEKTSQEPIILAELTPLTPGDGETSSGRDRMLQSDDTKAEAEPLLLSQPKPEKPLNVMSFNDFSNGPELVDANDVLEKNNAAGDIENSNGLATVPMLNQQPRSGGARGRSLWTSEVSRSGLGGEEDQESNWVSYASFTQGRAMMFEPTAVVEGDQGGGLLAWTNLIILGVSMVTVFAFVSGETRLPPALRCELALSCDQPVTNQKWWVQCTDCFSSYRFTVAVTSLIIMQSGHHVRSDFAMNSLDPDLSPANE